MTRPTTPTTPQRPTTDRRSRLLVLSAVASAIAIIALSGNRRDEPAPIDVPSAPPALSIAGPDPAVGRLRADVAELRAGLDELTDCTRTRDPENRDPAEAETTAPDPAAALADAEEQVRQQAAFYARALTADPIDAAWSPEAERRVRSAFTAATTDAALVDATLVDVTCRASLCRLTLRFPSEQAREAGSHLLPQRVPWDTAGIMHPDERDPARVIVYAARRADLLPRQP